MVLNEQRIFKMEQMIKSYKGTFYKGKVYASLDDAYIKMMADGVYIFKHTFYIPTAFKLDDIGRWRPSSFDGNYNKYDNVIYVSPNYGYSASGPNDERYQDKMNIYKVLFELEAHGASNVRVVFTQDEIYIPTALEVSLPAFCPMCFLFQNTMTNSLIGVSYTCEHCGHKALSNVFDIYKPEDKYIYAAVPSYVIMDFYHNHIDEEKLERHINSLVDNEYQLSRISMDEYMAFDGYDTILSTDILNSFTSYINTIR